MRTAWRLTIFATALVAQVTALAQLQPQRSGTESLNADVLPPEKRAKFAQANPEDITDENFPELIESFDYPNADISEVVKAISKLTGKNFILEDNVRGKITIIAPSQITVAEAYKAFLSALAINGYTIVPSGQFLKIRQARTAQRDSIETYAGAYFPNTDQLITRIVKLKYINAEEVHKNLRILQSKDGEINPYPPTNSLIISDYGSNIERIQNILGELDVPGFEEQLAVIRIRFAKARDIADLIDQIINKGEGSRRGGGTRFGVPRFRPTTPGAAGATGGGTGAESYSLVVPDERTNSIIVVGNKAGIEKIRGLVAKLDFRLRPEDQGGVYVYYVRFGEAEQIANVLNGIAAEVKKAQQQQQQQQGGLGGYTPPPPPGMPGPTTEGAAGAVFGGDVKVAADKVTNSLIITASKQDYEVVKNLLAKIDISRDQVYVKAIIMEMRSQKENSWGINYYRFNADSNGIGRIGFRSGDISELTNPTGDAGAILGFGSGDTFEMKLPTGSVTVPTLASLVKFLQRNVGGNVLSTPQVVALDNEEALLEVGEVIPVGRSESTTGSTVTSSTQRENATIKLTITPSISPDTDSVRMKIDQQIKQATKRKVEAQQLAEAAVVMDTRNLKTVIVVDSGDTAVLGGLMTDVEDESVTKVPVLGDIPILGWLFKGKTTSKSKSNLVIFLTPKIIRNAKDSNDVLNAKLNERVDFLQRNMGGRDPHGAQIDALPRKSKNGTSSSEEVNEEEPAAETF